MDNKHGGNIHEVRRKKQAREIIDFSANINPLGISEKCKASIYESVEDLIHYPDPEYCDLFEAISKYHKIDKDNVILGNGAIECIFKMGEISNLREALILAPTFLEYERAFLKNGVRVNKYLLNEAEDFAFNYESFIEEIREETDIVVVCNPNNPTGDLINRQTMDKLLDYCRNHAIKLVIDEAFMEFVENEESVSMVSRIPENEHLFILRSLTKFFAIPGLRLGYVMTKNTAFKKAQNAYKIPWTINTIAANLAVVALDEREYMEETNRLIIQERNYLYKKLSEIKGIYVIEPNANYILFRNERGVDLAEVLLASGIMIRSCSNYTNLDSRYYRVAVKSRRYNEILIEKLQEIYK